MNLQSREISKFISKPGEIGSESGEHKSGLERISSSKSGIAIDRSGERISKSGMTFSESGHRILPQNGGKEIG